MTPRIDDIRDDDRYLDALGSRLGADDALGDLFEPWLDYVDDVPARTGSTRWSGVGRYARAGVTLPGVRRLVVGAGVATAALSISSVAAAVSGTNVPVLRELGNVTRALSGDSPMTGGGRAIDATDGASPLRTAQSTSVVDPTDPTSIPDTGSRTTSTLVIGPAKPSTSASRSTSALTRAPGNHPVRTPGSSSSTSSSSSSSTSSSTSTKPTKPTGPTTTTGPTGPTTGAPPTTTPAPPTTTGPTWGTQSPSSSSTSSSTTTYGMAPTSPTSTAAPSSSTAATSSSAATRRTKLPEVTVTGGTSGVSSTQRDLPQPIGSATSR